MRTCLSLHKPHKSVDNQSWWHRPAACVWRLSGRLGCEEQLGHTAQQVCEATRGGKWRAAAPAALRLVFPEALGGPLSDPDQDCACKGGRTEGIGLRALSALPAIPWLGTGPASDRKA